MYVVVYLLRGKVVEVVGGNEKPTKSFDNWASGEGGTREAAIADALAALDREADEFEAVSASARQEAEDMHRKALSE